MAQIPDRVQGYRTVSLPSWPTFGHPPRAGTAILSELAKPAPNIFVARFLESLPQGDLFTAAVCEAEIWYSLARLPAGRRRDELTAGVKALLEQGFTGRILRFDSACAALYGEIRAAREAAGRTIPVADAMIAATARAYGAGAIATRNTRDFEDCGVVLVDPWAVG